MDLGFLEQFPDIPQVAMDQIRAQKLKFNPGSETGVQHLSAEHDGGLPYRFFTLAVYDSLGSKLAKYEKFNNVDMIEWTVDSKTKPVAMVSELPTELLEFAIVGYREAAVSNDPNNPVDPYAHPIFGECVGGAMKPAYDRFKAGLTAPGLPLTKWGVLDDASVATLAKYGLASVEQFAAKPRSWIMNGNFPKNLQDAYERAVFYVNGKENRLKDDKLAEQLKALATENSLKDQALADMQERMAALEAMLQNAAPKKSAGRPKVIKTEEE